MSSTIRVIAGGTCGSCVSPLQDRKSRLTTSFGIVIDRRGIIVDHGYGIQNVVSELREQNVDDIIILQTHFHMDHIAGLSLNQFLFDEQAMIRGIWAPFFAETTNSGLSSQSHFGKAFDEAFHPQRWPKCPFRPKMNHFVNPESPECLPFGIRAFALNHPGGSVAYRIPHPSGDVVIATDHELNEATNVGYAKFVSGARLLIADVQYRQSEYDGEVGIGEGGKALPRKGWGHGTPELLLATLQKCEQAPDTLWVTHHDPMRSQDDLDAMFDVALGIFGGVCHVKFVSDGDMYQTES